jgi:hypothetical protein
MARPLVLQERCLPTTIELFLSLNASKSLLNPAKLKSWGKGILQALIVTVLPKPRQTCQSEELSFWKNAFFP